MNEILLLYEYVKENPMLSLVATMLFTLFIWLYKDSRSNQKNIYETRLSELNEKLRHLCGVEAMLSFYLNIEGNKKTEYELELYTKLGESNPSFSEDIRKAVVEFYNDGNVQRLVFINNLIQSKINKLRIEKEKMILENNSKDIDDYLRRLLLPFKSVGAVGIGLLFVYIFISIFTMLDSIYLKIVFTFLMLSLMCSFTIFTVMIFVLKMKQTKLFKDYKFIMGNIVSFLLPIGPILLSNGILIIIGFFVQIVLFLLTTNYLKNKKKVVIDF